MALITCIECGRSFSTYANACPNCGCPTRVSQEAAKEHLAAYAMEQAAPARPQPAPQQEIVAQPMAPVTQPAPAPTQQAQPVAPNPPTYEPEVAETIENPMQAMDTAVQAMPQAAPVTTSPVVETSPAAAPTQQEALFVPLVTPIVGTTQMATAAQAQAPAQPEPAEQPKGRDWMVLSCPACGSTDIKFIATDYGVCSHCGSKVVRPQDNAPKAEIHIHAATGADSNAHYYGIKQDLQPNTFYRDAILDMIKDESTPPDLFDREFGPAQPSQKHMAVFTGKVSGSYTAEVGYDMVREWTEYSNGRAYTRRENYIKWEPFSGSYAGEQHAFIALDPEVEEGVEDAYMALWCQDDFDALQQGTSDIITPKQSTLNEAVAQCKRKAAYECEHNLPGNHSRNFSFSGFATVDHYDCHTIPAYTIHFEYNGQPCTKSCFATQHHEKTFFGATPDISEDINKDVEKTTRPIAISSITLLSASILFSMVFVAIHDYIHRWLGLGILLPVALAAIGVTIGYWVWRKQYHQSIITANIRAKQAGADKLLAAKGLAPLTNEEKDILPKRRKKDEKKEN